jgi:hypothetical protein
MPSMHRLNIQHIGGSTVAQITRVLPIAHEWQGDKALQRVSVLTLSYYLIPCIEIL